MDSRRGALIISLDFELYWGVLETKTVEQYRQNLLGARAAIPKLLELFERYQVHATWATVGLLFFGRKPDLLEALPERQPAYRKGNLSSYREIPHIGETESEDPYHYGESLLRLIAACPNQEIGTHTFSHYYCLEDGQDATAFREDLRAAKRAARAFQVELKSIVFPRNQVNSAYLPICADEGLICYRGVEPGVQYEAVSNAQARSPWRRALRLADSYLPIPRASNRPESNAALVNVAGSRFLRPYSPRLAAFEPLRLRRITAEMTKAARCGGIYHLWWHPHNFGGHVVENLRLLQAILEHYSVLEGAFGMSSLSMAEYADQRQAVCRSLPLAKGCELPVLC